jgi:hypothetical protein
VLKTSSTSLNTYMVVMFNEKTDDCYVQFFNSKEACQLFIAFILENDNIVL